MKKNYLPVFLFTALLVAVLSFTPNNRNKNFLQSTSDTVPLAIKAKNHLGRSVVSTNGLITFTTGLENDFYRVDSSNKAIHFYVEAKLAKFLNPNARRIPLNISIVIDRSGSMEGIKMGYAKKAAKGIIDQLQPDDIVSVVMYDTYVDTVQSPIHVLEKEKIKARIDKIVPKASTNLWGGAEQGYQYVQKNYKPDYINRVLLISDGNANTGLTDSTLIHLKVQKYKDDNGISISTFGVGLDYNETLMTDMAETGAGNYYFIDAPDKMTSIFNNELKGLLNVAAQNAELKIKIPKGVSIQKSYPLNIQQEGDEITIKLRDLSSNEIKASLFTFKIDDKVSNVLKFLTTLSFTDVSNGQQKVLTNENMLSPTKRADDYLAHFNKSVIQQTILYTANERLEMAMNLMEKGDHKGAQKYLEDNNDYLRANAIYVSNDGGLMRLDSVNNSYNSQYMKAELVSKDSVKKIQKASKAVNYRIRNKKQQL
jgi:Ca-activated chloride channel family protein